MSTGAAEAAVARERPHGSPLAAAEHGSNRCVVRSAGPVGTLRRLEAQQTLSHHEQVRERRRHHEPMTILTQPAVAHLREAEDALDHPNRMFDAGANAGL